MPEVVDESGKENPWKDLQLFTLDPNAVSNLTSLSSRPLGKRPEECFTDGLALRKFDLERIRTATDGSSVRCKGRLHIFKGGSHKEMLLIQNLSTGQHYQVTDKQWAELAPQTEEQKEAELAKLNRAALNRHMLGAMQKRNIA